ncbi:hypothetical protein DBR06_SOUSAS11710033, partial [Sousa chinensis]
GVVHHLHSLPCTTGLGYKQTHQMTIRTPAPMLSIDYQPLHNSPHLRPIQSRTVPETPPSTHVPDKPFTIVFMRWDKDVERCSRIRTTLSFHPPEKPT